MAGRSYRGSLVRTLTRQMTDTLRLLSRQQENEWNRNLLREISLPTFSGENVEDTGEFLRDIEQYIYIENIPENFQAKIMSKALTRRDKVWFNAVRGELHNMEEFSMKFRDEFLSCEKQERAKEIWKPEKYKDGSLLNYFYLRVGEANRFVPPDSEYHRNRIIIGQLPRVIQIAMMGTDISNTGDVVRALTRADEARVRNFGGEMYQNKGLTDSRYNRQNEYGSNSHGYRCEHHAQAFDRQYYNSKENINSNNRTYLRQPNYKYNNNNSNQQKYNKGENFRERKFDNQNYNRYNRNNDSNRQNRNVSTLNVDRNNKEIYEKPNYNEITTIAEVHNIARGNSDSENLRTARD